jgi:hypothetical protein
MHATGSLTKTAVAVKRFTGWSAAAIPSARVTFSRPRIGRQRSEGGAFTDW